MEFLLEALLEVVLQIICEVVIVFLDFMLEALLGRIVAERVRVAISTLLFAGIGVLGGWVSVKILPTPIGGGVPNIWIYSLVLPLAVAAVLFFLLRKSQQKRSDDSSLEFAGYCVILSWTFSVARYYFIR